MKIQTDGKFVVEGVALARDFAFASGTCQRVPSTDDLWRCPVLSIDESVASRFLAAALEQSVRDGEPGGHSAMYEAFMYSFAPKDPLMGQPTLFRRNGVVFKRLGRFKATMIGPSETNGTTGDGWSLRRVD